MSFNERFCLFSSSWLGNECLHIHHSSCGWWYISTASSALVLLSSLPIFLLPETTRLIRTAKNSFGDNVLRAKTISSRILQVQG